MPHTMNTQTSGNLVVFGIFLILLGVAGYTTNPERAHTALISGGGFGLLSILWGILGAKRVRWSLPAALATTALLILACAWRGSVGWLAVSRGESEKFFPAILISVMLVASVVVLTMLFKAAKSQPYENPQPKE
jgi:uncharacterized membrane protein (UPF0136 family)